MVTGTEGYADFKSAPLRVVMSQMRLSSTQAEQGLLQQPPPLAMPVTLTPQAMLGLIL